MNNILLAFGLTLIAGLSTGIGSAMAFFTKRTNKKVLSISLGFSAGVMIFVALAELYGESVSTLSKLLGETRGQWLGLMSFFGGILLIAFIDRLIPEVENPHELDLVENMNNPETQRHLLRLSGFTALAIMLHNLPEGLATFISALQKPSIAYPIVIAIAIHNIPEGIAVSIPMYYATGSRSKAFFLSFLSGLSEPIGALVFYLIFKPIVGDMMLGVLFGVVAGIMIYISIDELLPSAQKYGEHHLSIYGMIIGMLIMAVSLIILS
jgi:zinc transporter, ZIP family